MPNVPNSLVDYLRTVAGTWRNDPRNDAELLAQYADGGDDLAFKTIVWRHGPMVWRSCLRVMGNSSDAEDAFQVTFLALARQAARLRREPLAGWLHRVARRTALNAKAEIQRRRKLEHQVTATARPQESGADRAELQAVIDEELANLPAKLRVPLVLYYLEEKTQGEVARILGCARSVIQNRLAKGEAILRERLDRRGVTLGVGSIAAILGGINEAPEVPAGLIANTAKAALSFRAGTFTGASAESAEKLLRSLSWKGVAWSKWWVVMAVCFLGIGGVSGLVAWKMSMSGEDVRTPTVSIAPVPVSSKTAVKSNGRKVDCYGDPLPEGALARIGTVRFRPLKNGDDDVAFLPDGKTLISSNDGFLYFWEWSTGRELRKSKERICGHQIAVSPDGRVLATAGRYWDISVYPPQLLDRATAPLSRNPRDMQSLNESNVAFSPDGRMVAWACGAVGNARHPELNTIYLVDTSTGEVKKMLKEEIHPADEFTGGLQLAFSSDSKALASGGWAGRTTLWDVSTGTKKFQINGNGKQIVFLAFLPDGRTLIEFRRPNDKSSRNGLNQIMRFLDASTGKEQQSKDVLQISNIFCGKNQPGRACFSSDGKFLALNGHGIIGVWNMATGQEVGPAGGIHFPVRHLTFSSDSKKLVTLECPFKLWDADTGRFDKEVELATWNWELQDSFASYYSDARHLEVIYQHQEPSSVAENRIWSWRFLRWDTVTGKIEQREQQFPTTLMSVRKSIPKGAMSSDGRWQALILDKNDMSNKKDIALIDRTKGKAPNILSEVDDPNYVAFSSDGQSLLANSSDGQRLCVWSTATGKPRMSLEVTTTPNTSIRRCALSPDGRWLAVILRKDQDPNAASVRVLEVASCMEKVKFDAVWNELQCLEWSSDGRLLAAGGGRTFDDSEDGEGTICLWDVVVGREVRRFKGHQDVVGSLTFSPDGLRLASGSQDTTALVWDLSHLSRPEEVELVPVPTANELWVALRKPDTAGAWQAMRWLSQHPDVTIPLLRERLLLTPSPDQKIAVLLTQLDGDDFQVRKKAEEQLTKMGEEIEPTLLTALKDKLNPEIQSRINNVLNKIATPLPSGLRPSQLQACRAVAVLEWIGSSAARQVLEELSRLPTGLVQTEEAKAALQRLAKLAHSSVR